MKKRIGFIMPRLIGATVVVGLAALVITTLFKLMLGLVILGGAISLIGRKVGMRRQQYMAQYQDGTPSINNGNNFGRRGKWANQAQPISARATRKASTIVPID